MRRYEETKVQSTSYSDGIKELENTFSPINSKKTGGVRMQMGNLMTRDTKTAGQTSSILSSQLGNIDDIEDESPSQRSAK